MPRWEELKHCPHCGAAITLDDVEDRVSEKYTASAKEEPGEVDLTEEDAKSQWARDHADYDSDTEKAHLTEDQDSEAHVVVPRKDSPSVSGKISWVLCNACHAVIMHPNAKFCMNCGANLSKGASGETLLDLNEEAETCMICKNKYREGDIAIRCPRCGRLAHRAHLLEWLHANGFCPACKAKVSEDELEGQLG